MKKDYIQELLKVIIYRRKKKEEERYKRKIKVLKKEIRMLNTLLSIAEPEAWDLDGVYEDVVSGRNEYTGEISEPDKGFAKWLKKRYNLKKEVHNSSQP